jgi:microsomal epoxide hydrolase
MSKRCGKIALLTCVVLATAAVFADAQKKSWRDASVEVGDIKIHYLEAGAGDRHLVFIPGWTMNAEVWKEQIPYFAARGFHVLALDPRSQGQTTKTEEGNTYAQHAADLHVFLKQLNAQHAVLVGWSAGALTILEYLLSPEAIRPDQVVFVDPAPLGLKQPEESFGLTAQQFRELGLSLQQERKKATAAFVKGMFKSKAGDFLLNELAVASLKTSVGTATALMFDIVTGDRRRALPRVSMPALIMVGPDNRLYGEHLQSKIQRAKLEVIPETGHALFLEKPQAFNQALEGFLGGQ